MTQVAGSVWRAATSHCRFMTLTACLVAVGLTAAACWIIPKHESVKLTFDNRTDSLICFLLTEEGAAAGACGQEIKPMTTASWEPGCGYGQGAEKLSLTVILSVREGGRRIYDRTAECRVWQDSDGVFVIEQDGDDFVVTDPLADTTPSP